MSFFLDLFVMFHNQVCMVCIIFLDLVSLSVLSLFDVINGRVQSRIPTRMIVDLRFIDPEGKKRKVNNHPSRNSQTLQKFNTEFRDCCRNREHVGIGHSLLQWGVSQSCSGYSWFWVLLGFCLGKKLGLKTLNRLKFVGFKLCSTDSDKVTFLEIYQIQAYRTRGGCIYDHFTLFLRLANTRDYTVCF